MNGMAGRKNEEIVLLGYLFGILITVAEVIGASVLFYYRSWWFGGFAIASTLIFWKQLQDWIENHE